MKFKSGDRVSFLNDVGGGVVNRTEGVYVYVLTTDGFEIPVPEKELVYSRDFVPEEREREEPKVSAISPKPESPAKERKKPAEVFVLPQNLVSDTPVQLLLGFIPENEGPVFASPVACYLVNDSAYAAFYNLGRKVAGVFHYLDSGYIEPDTKRFIAGFDHTELSKTSDLHVQLVLLCKGRYLPHHPVDEMVNLSLVNFSKESYFRENDYFNEKAVLFEISGSNKVLDYDEITVPPEVREMKSKADEVEPARPGKKEPANDTLEVDLHFSEIDQKNSQLAPNAILALQLSRFHSAIEEAISKNMRRVVVIHGFGQGTLKTQIRKELQEKYPSFVFQDASFKEYGFGATMIHLNIDKKQ
ncbi:MAG: DUF2027 domain-containing protein [Bacteroidales bacterium]|nr:DUF2027 domain-containing protein [Bacteroidales bacterium]